MNTNTNANTNTTMNTTTPINTNTNTPAPINRHILNLLHSHHSLIWKAFRSLNTKEQHAFITYCDIINLLNEHKLSEILKIDINEFTFEFVAGGLDYVVDKFLYIFHISNFHLKIPYDEIREFYDKFEDKYGYKRHDYDDEDLHALIIRRDYIMFIYLKVIGEYRRGLYNAIKKDDADGMMRILNKTSFESMVKLGCDITPAYCRFYNEFVESTHMLFITISMLCGSPKCFKYLMLINHVNFNDDNLLAAIIGGNLEIFHIVEQHTRLRARHLEAAICWCRFDIAEYIITRMNIDEGGNENLDRKTIYAVARECMCDVMAYVRHIQDLIVASSNHSFYDDIDLRWITQDYKKISTLSTRGFHERDDSDDSEYDEDEDDGEGDDENEPFLLFPPPSSIPFL